MSAKKLANWDSLICWQDLLHSKDRWVCSVYSHCELLEDEAGSGVGLEAELIISIGSGV